MHAVPASAGAFFDLQLQMTPSPATTLAGTFGSGRIRSLRDLAASNSMMLVYLQGLLRAVPSQLRPHLNVVTTDFSEAPTVLPFVEALDSRGG